jgi:C4-type Zn-finger protein
MENQIECPSCSKTLSNKTIIDEAAKGMGPVTQSLICECGERVTYWQITAQLRDQKTMGRRFQNWVRSFLIKKSA